MPSPSKGLPVTGVVAPGIGVGFELTRDATAKSGSASKLTVATPAAAVEPGSVTKDVPFHTITSLDAVILVERKAAVSALGNVPGYGEPFRVTSIPTATTTAKPAGAGIVVGSAPVTVICTNVRKAPAGMEMRKSTSSTASGPMVPPPGPMVTVVSTPVNPPGGTGAGTGGGP
jgi:hypothetical protein